MRDYNKCSGCSNDLHADDIAIYKKLISRGAEEFLCIDCLAKELGCGRKDIERLIDYYRTTGTCILFR